MSDKLGKTEMGRRGFLRGAGTGAVAAAATAVMAAPGQAPAAENADQRKKARYRETEHVKKYYDSNRL